MIKTFKFPLNIAVILLVQGARIMLVRKPNTILRLKIKGLSSPVIFTVTVLN